MKRREFIAVLGAAAWPVVARAQRRMPVVGYVSGGPAANSVEKLAVFREVLATAGYIEGRNVAIEFRWAEGHFDRLPAMIADLVQRGVDVIVVADTTAAAIAAKDATKTIPVVFAVGSDPVSVGLVASLNRPGGNITGSSNLQTAVIAKRLQLFLDVVPGAKLVGFLVNPVNGALADADTKEAQAAARLLGTNLLVVNASSSSEIDDAFTTLISHRADAFLTNSESFFMIQRNQFAILAARYKMPAIYGYRENALAGGLMSYGADIVQGFRVVADYTGRILKGEKPADLPVQQSTRIELVLNMKAAKALGLAFPLTLLSSADTVIE
jgi:putative ABC transport system substrate-binding protein